MRELFHWLVLLELTGDALFIFSNVAGLSFFSCLNGNLSRRLTCRKTLKPCHIAEILPAWVFRWLVVG